MTFATVQSFIAQSDSGSSGAGGSLLFIAGLFVLFYFLAIRPQQKRVKAQQALAASIEPGDEVETVAGIFGKVRAVDDDKIDLEVGDGVVIKMARGAVRRKVIA